MSWFKDLTSKAEAVLVKLDQNAAQALQNPASILSDLTYTGPESDVDSESRELIEASYTTDSRKLPDTVIHANDQEEISKVEVHQDITETTSNLTLVDPSDWISERHNPSKALNQVIPGDVKLETTPKSKQVEKKIQVENSTGDVGSPENGTTGHSKKFTIQTSRTKSNLFSEINAKNRNGSTRLEKERSERNYQGETIPNLGADDIRASINQTLNDYNSTYLTPQPTNHLDSLLQDSNHNHSSHFDNHPNIVQYEESNSSSRRRNSTLSYSIDFPDDYGQKTDITTRLLQQNILKRKSAFNLNRVINKLANTNAKDYIVLSDQKRVKIRRFKLRLATQVRRLSYYFQTYPNMKYYAIGYVVLMQLLVVYVLFFYQSTPTPSDLSVQINKQLQDV